MRMTADKPNAVRAACVPGKNFSPFQQARFLDVRSVKAFALAYITLHAFVSRV